MIAIKVPQEEISINQLSLLQDIETKSAKYVKDMLNTAEFRHLKVSLQLSVVRFDGQRIRIVHNASFSLASSMKLAMLISSYFEKCNVNIILPNHSLLLDLDIKGNSQVQPEKQNDSNKKNILDETPDFYPQDSKYSFEQMILSDNIRIDVFDALKVISCKDLIYNKWGFGEIEPIPKSVLNLYGPPGTGKTMCAHAIAKYLNKKILSLNYSEIESKYVGEAPKNLQKAFDVAKETDSVLFFDEADSFLGKRIQNVTHGSDQALNSLRSQMLILLEEFPGIVVFATNLVTNFDKAFESRILKHIRFELPNQEARADIIRKMLPKQLPLAVPFTDEQIMEASAVIDGFSGREIKVAILDMLLSKADLINPNIVFSYEDLFSALSKKKESKDRLKAEEETLLKEKIAKKLREKAKVAEMEVEQQNNN